MQLFDTITLRRSNTFEFSSFTPISSNTHINNEINNNNINDIDNINGRNNFSNGVAVQKSESSTTNLVNKYKLTSSDAILSKNDNVYENIPDNCRMLIKSVLDLIMTEHMEQLTAAQSTA